MIRSPVIPGDSEEAGLLPAESFATAKASCERGRQRQSLTSKCGLFNLNLKVYDTGVPPFNKRRKMKSSIIP